ncbi:hypothetical protein Kpol_1064p53 [Vanderwaltozyma polyspora DSM 70294]|uniref:Uncharacterized protein n=1 Tax=Vanderwaltozyma polyspora (strain ATCC 22028 / DSM 70294 / BCRC 21397 / CBS 2163 / NBRC 10782 / NRRL Y-8283 / UCD 57-17) TaxID=436907 RepID=A7TMH7_VANPO|nr:uncharacterized protein Kpol_1064p53 [Vanderwaltozyma polyspora DSM 70294]EDO16571.1 hypothetical protein Kpol_1064p53 [Vanderwaltozyma polyspora DSM 70294]
MASVLPQLVNIEHTLQSKTVEQIRDDIKEFQDAVELNSEQSEKIQSYIHALEDTFDQFTKDNEHIERKDNNVTDADIQLYTGLKNMYQDYLKVLNQLKQDKAAVRDEVEASDDKPEESSDVLEYIVNELPYQQPTERKKYIDNFIHSKDAQKLSKSTQVFDAIVNLCLLDSSINDNLRSYFALLKDIGYTHEDLSSNLPGGLLEILNSKSKSKNKEGKENKVIQEDVEETKENTDNSPVSNNSGNNTEDEKKKKISFSKYLKKDTDVNENGKRISSSMEPESSSDDSDSKKIKTEDGKYISSILKQVSDQNGNGQSTSRKSSNNIRFVDDSKLVTVFGDGLPQKGVQLSPDELKKLLKPFKEGEPRDLLSLEGVIPRARELSLILGQNEEDYSDVSSLKGGPIPYETTIPLKFRINFGNFSPDLSKGAREPVLVDDLHDKSGNLIYKGPLIAGAFGKNNLLLRKDRGGLPYKRVPEVLRNDYPPRPTND